jgi:hypothetical protein
MTARDDRHERQPGRKPGLPPSTCCRPCWGCSAWPCSLPAASFEFTNLDDNVYVVDNPALAKGLSGEGVRWAFTTRHGDLWMPATWLTYLADYPAGGRDGRAPFTARTSRCMWRARCCCTCSCAGWPVRCGGPALVAALFAIHPLHVESVAGVAERKDVLSGFFFLLALLPHAKPDVAALSPRARLFSLLCFAVALMSKPMVVTLPVVLLLLDFRQPGQRPALRRLLVEKLPYLALAAAVVGAHVAPGADARHRGGRRRSPFRRAWRRRSAIARCTWSAPSGRRDCRCRIRRRALLFSPAQVALAAGALAAVSWLAWRAGATSGAWCGSAGCGSSSCCCRCSTWCRAACS